MADRIHILSDGGFLVKRIASTEPRVKRGVFLIQKTCGIRASVPAGGVHYWVRLPEGLTGARLLPAAQKEGVTFIPGELFYPEKSAGKQFIRLNFSYPGISQIEEGMLMLERAVIRCLDSQGGSGREAF